MIRFKTTTLAASLIGFGVILSAAAGEEKPLLRRPRVADDRLVIELVASEPDIVTPFGIDVDEHGRLFVVESHTHMRPDDYDGPPHDRLRLIVDRDGDGKPERVTTFYEGDRWLMNVAVHPNGWIYCVSRNELFRVRDADGDGRADVRETLAKMETTADYPHNGFLSLTIGFRGELYFGMGQNYGAQYVLKGRDGAAVQSGHGDGGIFRCSETGEGLERVAVGFWNPCGIARDPFGRLFTVDNDPGNRPPCRLIEVVSRSDYGYRRRELEPFIGWNGELPGTLPMIASCAEAPTDVIAYESTGLPDRYRGMLLVSSWSEHRIDGFALRPCGAGFAVQTVPLVHGDSEFRPAGLAVGPDGSIYISDWVDRSYPVHGRGRVWRLRRRQHGAVRPASPQPDRLDSADRAARERAARQAVARGKEGIESLVSQLERSTSIRVQATALEGLAAAGKLDRSIVRRMVQHDEAALRELTVRLLPDRLLDVASLLATESEPRVRAAALRRAADADLLPQIIEALVSRDPFLRQAALVGLHQSATSDQIEELAARDDARIREAAFLLLRRAHPQPDADWLESALTDPAESIRYLAIATLGEGGRPGDRDRLLKLLESTRMSRRLFEATMAAIAKIDGVLRAWRPGRNGDWWKSQGRITDVAVKLLNKPNLPPQTIRQAIAFLPPGHSALTVARLKKLLDAPLDDIDLQLTAIRAVPTSSAGRALLQRIAGDQRRHADVRAEAVMRLDPSGDAQLAEAMVGWAESGPAAVREEVLRSLRGVELDARQKTRLRRIAEESFPLKQLVMLVLEPSRPVSRGRPASVDAWLGRLKGRPDARAGSRVFFHRRGPGCGRCHRIDGRGAMVGPNIVRAAGTDGYTRQAILRAILRPSDEIALGYVPYRFWLDDGRVVTGVLKSESDTAYEIVDAEGHRLTVPRVRIEAMSPSRESIMPERLVDRMTDTELRDVIEFIRRGTASTLR